MGRETRHTHGRESVEEAGNVSHDTALIGFVVTQVLDFEELRDAEVLLCNAGLAKLQEQTKGMSLAQAEEFVQHSSEALLKEAQDFFKEAVRVIPPEDSSAMTDTAIWDGSDSWMVTTSDPATPHSKKGKGKSGSISFAGNRTAALMTKLRTEADVLLLDPASEPSAGVKAVHEKWKADSISSKGEFISDAWTEDRERALAEDDGTLSALHDKLGESPHFRVRKLFIKSHYSPESIECSRFLGTLLLPSVPD